jgi:hypothetical protein
MQTFRVVKERHGWAVRLGDVMSTHFWTRALAIREAQLLCDSLRRHGVAAEVLIDNEAPQESAARAEPDARSAWR